MREPFTAGRNISRSPPSSRAGSSSIRAVTTIEAISAFWKWWPSAAPGFAASFSSGEHSDARIAEMNERVSAIGSGLDWEFGPGHEAEHHLCLSSHGDPELRIVAERWLERAPAADATWEFHGARQAHPEPDLTLTIDEVEVGLGEIRYELDVEEDRARVVLTAWHPAFATIEDASLRRRILFIALDTLLGEDEVERWIGAVSTADEPIEDGATPSDLRATVAELSELSKDDMWQMLRGEDDGKPVLVVVDRAVKRVDHWLKDTLLRIRVTLTSANEEGIPSKDESEVLNEAEDALVASLGEHAVYIARETHASARTLFFHVEESSPAVDVATRWKPTPAHVVDVHVERDPAWEILERWG